MSITCYMPAKTDPSPLSLGAVLFDLDGTLVDTAADFEIAVNALRHDYALPPLPAPQIAERVSDGSTALTRLALSLPADAAELPERRQQLLGHYRQSLGLAAALYPSLDNVLLWLQQQQIPWGIVTNKPERFAIDLLEKLGLGHCPVLVCPEHVEQAKPHPEPLLLACNRLGIKPESALYIGDHERDILAGRAAAMRTVIAGYGYIPATESCIDWGADYHVEQPDELLALLASLL